MITELNKQLTAFELPIDAFNIGIKFDTLHYDSKGQQTANIDLKGNYTILGECKKFIYGFNYSGKIFEGITEIRTLLQSKGCILNDSNKFIILKKEP